MASIMAVENGKTLENNEVVIAIESFENRKPG